MFVAVLTASTLFTLTAASGSSTACTVLLPAVAIKTGECQASRSETMNEIKQNVSTLLQDVIHCMQQLGHTHENPANSCAQLAEREPDIPSGNYWILNSTQSPVQVFCEMGEVFPAGLNVTGGWVRVANLNMTNPNQQCPKNLTLSYTNQRIRLCGKSTDNSCDSVTYSSYGVQYQQVCGRVRGYQYISPDGFERHSHCPAPCTIDNPYVDGVSITHGVSPRKHIWTYAVGAFDHQSVAATCPCAGGTPPPSFVGSDYYCESGHSNSQRGLATDDPLWDGQDCAGLERTCCDSPNLPWFCKKLPEPTTDNLEFRLCGDERRNNENIPIDLVELYIQ